MLELATKPNDPTLVGSSLRTRQTLNLIQKLGRNRWPVLIVGETGTGKEVVARAIHNINPTGPFVTIDCSSMVGPLMESELFGHVKGAFTGAATSKKGLIEMANGGTALLDEIGELPLDLQSKLLRVLQEKEFRPVGAVSTRRSDFRMIAATNRDLVKDVEEGRFRRDLYFRLNVINIRLAPLRERREDIPALVDHFLARSGGDYTVTTEALEVMMLNYNWPGNVRELENCVQHMVAVGLGPLLHVTDMPENLLDSIMCKKSQYLMAASGTPPAPKSESGSTDPSPLPESVAPGNTSGVVPLVELERRAIINALDYTKGDRAVAAHLLGIGRTTLYRKLKEYHLD